MRIILQKNVFVLLLCFCLTTAYAQESEYGIASYYGDEYHGGETTSGQRYDKNLLTAAHKSLPMGTKIRVTRLDTKKTVDVTINDRGPYVKGRVLDLSGKAAEVLGIKKDGTANIKLDVLGKGKAVVAKAKVPEKTTTKRTTTTDPKTSPPVARPKVKVPPAKPKATPKPPVKEAEVFKSKGKTKPAKPKTTYVPAKKATVEDPDAYELVTAKDYNQYGLYKIELTKPINAAYGVQVASLSSYSNALKQVATLQGKWFKNILLNIEPGVKSPNFKVILGPFPDAETAKSYQKHAKKKGVNGFVISLEEE